MDKAGKEDEGEQGTERLKTYLRVRTATIGVELVGHSTPFSDSLASSIRSIGLSI